MASQQPFGLFVLADIPNEALNALLQRANREQSVELSIFLLAKADLSDAPRPRQDNEVNQGSPLPIFPEYVSPFVGFSAQKAGDLLRTAGIEVDLVRDYFAVIDSKSVETDTWVICKIYPNNRVDRYRIESSEAAMELETMMGSQFELHKKDLKQIAEAKARLARETQQPRYPLRSAGSSGT